MGIKAKPTEAELLALGKALFSIIESGWPRRSAPDRSESTSGGRRGNNHPYPHLLAVARGWNRALARGD